MGENGSSWLPDASSSFAGEVDALFNFVLVASAILFVAVVASMIYYVIRYRRRSEDYVPVPDKDSKWLEMASIVFPTILVLILFTWGFRVFVTMSTAPPDSYEISVRAGQWFWEFGYDNGVVSANDLYVPINRPIKLKMSSDDVLHSFFVPDFRIKQDVIPNRYTTVWFEVTATGEYMIYCTEYCGTQHSAMLGTVIGVSQSEFDTWLESQSQDRPPVELGEMLFSQYSCNACHSINGVRGVGPAINGLMGITRTFEDGTSAVVDDNYLLDSIKNPAAQIVSGFPPAMPASFGSLSAKQLDGLIAYIKSLE